MAIEQNPYDSRLSSLTERGLLVKILAELRVHTYLLASDMDSDVDIDELRNDAMSDGGTDVNAL